MITKEYIKQIKKTETFDLLKKGLVKGHYNEVLLGISPYDIAFKTEAIPTVPSLVFVVYHILLMEGQVERDAMNAFFKEVEVTKENVCMILDYLEVYLIYRRDHTEVKIDDKEILNKCRSENFKSLHCYIYLMNSIEEKLANAKS